MGSLYMLGSSWTVLWRLVWLVMVLLPVRLQDGICMNYLFRICLLLGHKQEKGLRITGFKAPIIPSSIGTSMTPGKY